MDKINKKLHQAMEQKLDQIIADPGDEDKQYLYDQLETMYKARTEYEKIAQGARENETQTKEHRKDRIVNVVTQVGLAVGGWVVYDAWYKRGLKFEETGSLTTTWIRNLISKMFPKK